MIDAIIQKLSQDIPALNGRVQGALDLAALVAEGKMPHATVAAFVLPLGQRGLQATAVTGAFVQSFDEMIGVVLTLRSRDATGKAGIDPLRGLITAVFDSIAGWSPDPDGQDVLRLLRGGLLTMSAGLIVYQLDFATTDQMRIAR